MKIMIACGGTGGHIFPGLSLYNSLKRKQPQAKVILVLDKRDITGRIVTGEFPCIYLLDARLKFKFNLQGLFIVLKLIRKIFQSLWVIVRFRPNVVVGFGGISSFFILFFASIFRIKTIIHESNVSLGRANKLLTYFVSKIAISFEKTKASLGRQSYKAVLTGNPLRPNLAKIQKLVAMKFFDLPPDKFTILIMGGSQGAHNINATFVKAAKLLVDKIAFEVIHLCGSQDYTFLDCRYKDFKPGAKLFDFLGPMEYAYSAADIIIARAGAASINEIAFFGLPSILLPYPYVRRHQIENASYFKANNAAIVIDEKELNPEILRDKILELFYKPGLRQSINQHVSKFSYSNADDNLSDLVLLDPGEA